MQFLFLALCRKMYARKNRMCRLLLKLENKIEVATGTILPRRENEEEEELPVIDTDEQLGDFESQLGGPDRVSLVKSSDLPDNLFMF